MPEASGLSRRHMLRLGVLTAVVGAAPLAGCGSDDEGTPAAAAGEAKSGTLTSLKIGAFDGTNTAGLDPRSASNGASVIVMKHVYDSLMLLGTDEYAYSLAKSAEPNQDATSWTITIRDDATFHDGKPVTAQDVAYSLQTLGTPPSNRASLYADVDLAAIKVVDEHTLEVPLKRARGDFREGVLVVYSTVFPDGTKDFEKGIGSGPYKLAGNDQQSVKLSAVEGHWSGKPSVGELLISRIADPTARLNAAQDGQIDYAVQISATGAKVADSAGQVEVKRGGPANANALSFAMNMQMAPFDDPRVRQAVRLAADRQALVDHALLGFGTVGADVVGKGLPGYAAGAADRTRDVEQAKQLFAAAGVTKLTLRAAELVPGMVAAAELFKQQLKEAGVDLKIQTVPADSYYADLTKLASYPFQTFYYANRPAALHLASVTVKGAPFNVIGTGADYQSRLAEAQTVVDDAARASAFEALQMEMYQEGGDLLWAFQENIDLARPGLQGVVEVASIPSFTATTTTA